LHLDAVKASPGVDRGRPPADESCHEDATALVVGAARLLGAAASQLDVARTPSYKEHVRPRSCVRVSQGRFDDPTLCE